jgi:hypothetical protein
MKTDHAKRIRAIQKDIDMVDELKEKIQILENRTKGI